MWQAFECNDFATHAGAQPTAKHGEERSFAILHAVALGRSDDATFLQAHAQQTQHAKAVVAMKCVAFIAVLACLSASASASAPHDFATPAKVAEAAEDVGPMRNLLFRSRNRYYNPFPAYGGYGCGSSCSSSYSSSYDYGIPTPKPPPFVWMGGRRGYLRSTPRWG